MTPQLLSALGLGAAVLLGAAAPEADVAVFVLDHAIEAQDQLAAGDLVEAHVPPGTARGALGVRDIVGMEATRRMASGSIVRATDIVRPQLVRRGEPVTITIRTGTLVISTSGRALASGAAGAPVRVVTLSTSRTLDGVVEGPGAVRRRRELGMAMKRFVPILVTAVLLSGCGSFGKLATIGKAPKMSPPEAMPSPVLQASLGRQGSTDRAGPEERPAPPPAPSASLFRTGAGAFFRDQRAGRVGDILTVRIKIDDRADFGNTTSRSRTGSEKAGLAALFGLETPLAKVLPGAVDTSKLVGADSTSKSDGSGSISRKETINMTIAATVTGVLPNGNLAIRGKQEVRVNYELRELVISGIVRPEDIARDNSIPHSQIAEARISYGGRGRLSDAQQDRWGQQIYDALFPF